MPMFRIRALEQKYGDLHKIIPRLVNERNQAEAGKVLGVSTATINRWLKDNGYKAIIRYVRESEMDNK